MLPDGKIRLGSLLIRDIFPVAQAQLPPPDERPFYEALTEKCEKMSKFLGTRGQGFKERKEDILRAAPDIKQVIGVMQGPAYIRPLLDLWKEERSGLLVPCTPELLGHLDWLARNSRRGRLGRLALRELCQFFFSRYDTLLHLKSLCQVLRGQFSLYQTRELLFGLDKLKSQEQLFLQEEGHIHLARLAEEHATILVDEAKAHGIPLTDSRFFEVAQQIYYLSRLRKLQINEESELLVELQEKKVYDVRLSAQKRLGHEVLTILIDTLRKGNCNPSELWRNTLLAIAGDPRVPITTPSYMDWWAKLDTSYADAMCEWLAEVDMELFLRIWKEYAQREGGGALQRMYPDRECFLRGIFSKKLVRGTRLFLGTDARMYVERTCRGKYRPYYTLIRDSGSKDLAVFYLNLGKAHIIEGTHNFRLMILAGIPPSSPLSGHTYQVERNDLRSKLKKQYIDTFGPVGYFEKVHLGDWRRDAVSRLQSLGIPLFESDVMSKASFMRSYR